MTHILILGANGQLARHTLNFFLAQQDVYLTLYLRRASRLSNPAPHRVQILEGDVLDQTRLRQAMQGQDVVYANLAGDLAAQARSLIEAMQAGQCKRLIFISSMGIYGEVPGEPYHRILDPYRDAASLIEASGLDYTLLRPGWFNREPEMDYQLTQKGEPFIGRDVSLNSLSRLIVDLATRPNWQIGCSLGVSNG